MMMAPTEEYGTRSVFFREVSPLLIMIACLASVACGDKKEHARAPFAGAGHQELSFTLAADEAVEFWVDFDAAWKDRPQLRYRITVEEDGKKQKSLVCDPLATNLTTRSFSTTWEGKKKRSYNGRMSHCAYTARHGGAIKVAVDFQVDTPKPQLKRADLVVRPVFHTVAMWVTLIACMLIMLGLIFGSYLWTAWRIFKSNAKVEDKRVLFLWVVALFSLCLGPCAVLAQPLTLLLALLLWWRGRGQFLDGDAHLCRGIIAATTIASIGLWLVTLIAFV